MKHDKKTHRLIASPKTVHTGFFDAALPPVITIESGDAVVMNSLMLMDGQLHCGMSLDELITARQFYVDRKLGPHTLTGPIFVQGSEPGDVLEIQIQKFILADCGVNYHFPGKLGIGGLPEDFPSGQIKAFHLDLEKMETIFAPGI
ncbi:MAG: amidase [Deltaproteobacteria bacterium]|nr:amidase [Deltaproteobacteria bacterium]